MGFICPAFKSTLIIWEAKDSAYVPYLQSNLRGALLSQNVEYRRTYLTALVAGGDSSSLQHTPQSPLLEEPAAPDCLGLLLRDLEDQCGGPEFLSQALRAASLLLYQLPDSRLYIF